MVCSLKPNYLEEWGKSFTWAQGQPWQHIKMMSWKKIVVSAPFGLLASLCTALECLCKEMRSWAGGAVHRHRVKLCKCRGKLPERWASDEVVGIRNLYSVLGALGVIAVKIKMQKTRRKEDAAAWNLQTPTKTWGKVMDVGVSVETDLGLEQGWGFGRLSIIVRASSCSMTVTPPGSCEGAGSVHKQLWLLCLRFTS